MIRKFLIVEVMLPGVSGEVGGEVSVDQWTGAVEQIDCQHFDFWCDHRDVPVVLDARQRALAREVVLQTLQADSELSDESGMYGATASSFACTAPAAMTEGEQALADYLESIRRDDPQPLAPAHRPARRSG